GVYDCGDCDATDYYCQDCIIKKHQNLPFHRIEEWDGDCLRRRSLAELGFIIFFGHGNNASTILRPRTAFTFRVLKLFHLLNHVTRTSPWDFTETMHRLTDHV
ncbi:hypothetical protein M422DRAFT_84453, partial [Sphaerobolus stellatus SS14]